MIRGIKRPRVKAIEIIEPKAQKIDAQLNVSIHNRFDIEVIEAKTGEIKQRAQAENVICNQLWTRMFAPSYYFGYIHYGTGSGTPSSVDTSLFTFLGYIAPDAANDVYTINNQSGYVSFRRRVQLSELIAVGSTLTEVGIGYSTTANSLCTHAMLKDMNGNPISIEKTSTDIINIYATIFLHWENYDSGYIQFIQPTGFNSSQYNGLLIQWLVGKDVPSSFYAVFLHGGVRTHLQQGNGVPPSGGAFVALSTTYSTATKTLTLTVTRLAIAVANLSKGIGTVQICKYAVYGNGTTTEWVPMIGLLVGGSWYQNSQVAGEAIGTGDGTTKDFTTSFDRIESGAVVYVDGVVQSSGVTVDAHVPYYYTDMGRYFQVLEMSLADGLSSMSTCFPTPTSQASHYLHSYPGNDQKAIYYNPFYSYGIKSFTVSNCTVEVSDDLVSWVDITSQASNVSVTYRQYKYWRLTSTPTTGAPVCLFNMTADTISRTTNIHFDTAPAFGAAITADYTTKTIAKDSNHVFDLTVTIQLGEYTE